MVLNELYAQLPQAINGAKIKKPSGVYCAPSGPRIDPRFLCSNGGHRIFGKNLSPPTAPARLGVRSIGLMGAGGHLGYSITAAP